MTPSTTSASMATGRVSFLGARSTSAPTWMGHRGDASVCQAVGRLGCAGGPGSDFSEVLVVEVGLAALDCRVALMCPPGPANAPLVVVDKPGIADIGQVAFKGSTGLASGFARGELALVELAPSTWVRDL